MEIPPSSTSRFRRWLPVLAPFVCVALGLAAGAAYLRHVNPQNAKRMEQIRVKQAAATRTEGQPRIIIAGDSSVAFGMDTELIARECGMPAVNLGFTAGCGALPLMGIADDVARPGDTVVLSFYPALWFEPVRPEPEGRVLTVMWGKPLLALGGTEPLIPATLVERTRIHLSTWSMGERQLLNDVGRFMLRMPSFRYKDCAIDQTGYFVGKVERPHAVGLGMAQLGEAWKPIIREYRDRLARRNVRLYYTVPWYQVTPETLDRITGEARRFEAQLSEIIPVLVEKETPVRTDPALFSDTEVHLSVQGGQIRSHAFAETFQAAQSK